MAGFPRRNSLVEEATSCGLIDEIQQRPNQRREELAISLSLPPAQVHRLVDGLHSLNMIDIISGKIKLKFPVYTTNNNNSWSNIHQSLSPPAATYSMMPPLHPPPPFPMYATSSPYIPMTTAANANMSSYPTSHTAAIYAPPTATSSLPSQGRRDQSGGQPNMASSQHQYQPLPPRQQYYNYNYPMASSVMRFNNGTTTNTSTGINTGGNGGGGGNYRYFSGQQQQGLRYPSVGYGSPTKPGNNGGGGERMNNHDHKTKSNTANGNGGVKDTKADNNGDGEDKSSQDGQKDAIPCAFFLKTGTCAWGDNCRFSHPYDQAPEPTFNSLGLPVRPDQSDCVFYMRTGRCSFGFTCKYNHPENGGGVGGRGGMVVLHDGGYGRGAGNRDMYYHYQLQHQQQQYGIGMPPNGGLPRMAPPPRRKQQQQQQPVVPVVVDVSRLGNGEDTAKGQGKDDGTYASNNKDDAVKTVLDGGDDNGNGQRAEEE